MGRLWLTGSIVLACGLLIGAAAGGTAGAVRVPDPGALNSATRAYVESVSCAAVGECAAGGSYRRASNHEAFVVSETNGTWGHAIEVPGTAALNKGGYAEVDTISCPTAGECAAAGSYSDGVSTQAFVVGETNGTWGTAIAVPGTAILNTGGFAAVESISCPAAGDCAVSGYYTDGSHRQQIFVAGEKNGSWSVAVEVPGTAALNAGGQADAGSISCPTAANCTAVGHYSDDNGDWQALVVTETNGIWGTAHTVPGTATLNTGGNAWVSSISCPAAGSCAAGGYYTDDNGYFQAFVVNKTNGSWGTAVEVPGTATLNTGGAGLDSISCAAAGDCAATGVYADGSGRQTFVVDETNGSWGTAVEVPGIATLNSGGFAVADSLSCAAPGECAASGYYTDGSHAQQTFVVDETGGSWGTAIGVPGTANPNPGGRAEAASISCAAPGECAAGGSYTPVAARRQAFVASERNGGWGYANPVPKVFASCVVPNVVGMPFGVAKAWIGASGCGLGAINKRYSSTKKESVIAQQQIPGKVMKVEAKVALTVSKGKRR
jgi:hypothetical protein